MLDSLQWAPDGARIAYDRWIADPARGVIVIVEVESGAEQVLEATIAPEKVGASFLTVTSNEDHHWFHESFSWAPDGRSILVLERHRTRPWVVDVETGRLSELPWQADSAPSWQRVAAE
jgi:hypothetical protein